MNANRTDPIQIRRGIAPELRAAAAWLYWQSFGHDLLPLPTPARQGAALICAAMHPERALIAVDGDGGLIGIAGLRGAAGGFLTADGACFRQVFGPIAGRLRHWSSLLHRAGAETGDLILDGVAVHPHWRGRGIARRLVRAAEAHARDLGHPALRAEVDARNHVALAAWAALAFQPAGRQRQGWPWRARAHVLRRPV